jgi:hypothetical protein
MGLAGAGVDAGGDEAGGEDEVEAPLVMEPVPMGQNLFRVVEPPEAAALNENSGVPTPSPNGQMMKPFFVEFEQASLYQNERIPAAWKAGSQIWQFPNPSCVGEAGPSVDSVPGPTWVVPNDSLPLIGGGWTVGPRL